ncbi:MAG: FtsX-like permease family protein [Solirubrobacteraceae bacterium]
MKAVLAWGRLDIRRRWRSLLVLTLLVALSSAVVLMTLSGARRTDTAIPRLEARVLDADVMVLPNQPHFDWAPVSRLPSVRTLGTFALMHDAGPQFDIGPLDQFGFPVANGQQNVTIDRPILRSGRFPDTNNALEALGSDGFIKKHGAYVTVRLPAAAQIQPDGSIRPHTKYAGPTVRVHIVGEGQNTFALDGLTPTFELSYGFFRAYIKPLFPYFANARVRLRGGEAAIPQFRRELAALTHRQDIDVVNWHETIAGAQRSATFTATGWLLFALVALLASLVLVGQAFARYCAGAADDLRTLGALGLDRRQSRLAAALGPALAGVAGCALGVIVALLASPLFPTGAVRRLEPAPGISLDPLAMLVGGGALAAIALLGSWWASRIPDWTRGSPRDRRSTVATAAARAGLGVATVLGARFALEPGHRKARVPVRPALLGAIAGVIGVVGALTFRTGLDDAVADPVRFGQTLPYRVFIAINAAPTAADVKAIHKAAASPDVAVLNDLRVAVFPVNDRQVSTFSLDPLKGHVKIVSLSGRPPVASDEISLGPQTADALHVRTGDTVQVGSRKLHVSGITFVPEDSHNVYADGAWLTPDGFAIQQPDLAHDKFHEVGLALAAGVSKAKAVKDLGEFGAHIEPSPVPSQMADLRDVRVQPLLLGAFLLLLAIGAIGHALATAVRKRRHDMAVLRSLGMTRRQTRLTVAAQASVIGIVGLVFGLPVGVAAGRTGWRILADATPVFYIAPLAVLVLVIAVPAALALANLLAALPAHRAARIRIADTLRAE